MQVHEQTAGSRTTWKRSTLRWLPTFFGFPLGGLAAKLIVGPVDGLAVALVGGAISGIILGAVQSWGMGPAGPAARRWITATAVGFMVGLGIGSAVVDYGTSLGDLVVQGAICGLGVGAAQALVLRPQLGRVALRVGARARRAVGTRLGNHDRGRHRRRESVHGLRLQRCARRHGRHRRPARVPRPPRRSERARS